MTGFRNNSAMARNVTSRRYCVMSANKGMGSNVERWLDATILRPGPRRFSRPMTVERTKIRVEAAVTKISLRTQLTILTRLRCELGCHPAICGDVGGCTVLSNARSDSTRLKYHYFGYFSRVCLYGKYFLWYK